MHHLDSSAELRIAAFRTSSPRSGCARSWCRSQRICKVLFSVRASAARSGVLITAFSPDRLGALLRRSACNVDECVGRDAFSFVSHWLQPAVRSFESQVSSSRSLNRQHSVLFLSYDTLSVDNECVSATAPLSVGRLTALVSVLFPCRSSPSLTGWTSS
jgi:hypothetical protein